MSMKSHNQNLKEKSDFDIIKELDIKRLPVNPVYLATKLNVQIHTYRALSDKRAVTTAYLCKQYSPDGFTLYNIVKNRRLSNLSGHLLIGTADRAIAKCLSIYMQMIPKT